MKHISLIFILFFTFITLASDSLTSTDQTITEEITPNESQVTPSEENVEVADAPEGEAPPETVKPADPATDTIPWEVIDENAPQTPVRDQTGIQEGLTLEEPQKKVEFSSRFARDLQEARVAAKRGAAIYFSGLALEYCVATPLAYAAVFSNEKGLAILSLGMGGVSGGLQIAGPIRNGVGASMAYDVSRHTGMGISRNVNWTFYKAGWAFNIIGVGINLISTFIPESDAAIPLAFVSSGVGLASDVMWIIAVCSSLKYTSKVNSTANQAQLQVYPCFTSRGGVGMGCSVLF